MGGLISKPPNEDKLEEVFMAGCEESSKSISHDFMKLVLENSDNKAPIDPHVPEDVSRWINSHPSQQIPKSVSTDTTLRSKRKAAKKLFRYYKQLEKKKREKEAAAASAAADKYVVDSRNKIATKSSRFWSMNNTDTRDQRSTTTSQSGDSLSVGSKQSKCFQLRECKSLVEDSIVYARKQVPVLISSLLNDIMNQTKETVIKNQGGQSLSADALSLIESEFEAKKQVLIEKANKDYDYMQEHIVEVGELVFGKLISLQAEGITMKLFRHYFHAAIESIEVEEVKQYVLVKSTTFQRVNPPLP